MKKKMLQRVFQLLQREFSFSSCLTFFSPFSSFMVVHGLEQGEGKVLHESVLGFFLTQMVYLALIHRPNGSSYQITPEFIPRMKWVQVRIFSSFCFVFLLSSVTQGTARGQGLSGFLLLIRHLVVYWQVCLFMLDAQEIDLQKSKICRLDFYNISVTNLITYCLEEIRSKDLMYFRTSNVIKIY